MSNVAEDEGKRLFDAYSRWRVEGFGTYVGRNRLEMELAAMIDSDLIPFRSLPENLWSSLKAIPAPSYPTKVSPHRPASVVLKSGDRLDAVCFLDEITFFGFWGYDSSKSFVPVSDIESIAPSPLQMPTKVANKIYKAGETRMGGTDAVLYLKGRRNVRCIFGGVVDFVRLPEPYRASDVKRARVLWSRPSLNNALGGPGFSWCVHLAGEEVVRDLYGQRFMVRVPTEKYLELRRPLEA